MVYSVIMSMPFSLVYSSVDTFKFKEKGKQITETCDKFLVVNDRTSRNTKKNFKTRNSDLFLQIILH